MLVKRYQWEKRRNMINGTTPQRYSLRREQPWLLPSRFPRHVHISFDLLKEVGGRWGSEFVRESLVSTEKPFQKCRNNPMLGLLQNNKTGILKHLTKHLTHTHVCVHVSSTNVELSQLKRRIHFPVLDVNWVSFYNQPTSRVKIISVLPEF